MKAIDTFRKVVVRVCAVCIGVMIVDTAYNTGKRNAYKECRDLVIEKMSELDMENEEGEAQ